MEPAGVEPVSFEALWDGVSARYCHIKGKYYISARDLVMGICCEDPKKDDDTWTAACKHASKTWINIIRNPENCDLKQYLETFQFKGKNLVLC